MEEECCATQLIDGDGEFNVAGLAKFMKIIRLADCGLSYAVVAIMGPQSSGKSTLLNHLFHTSFREMDAYSGRSQTTKGIWIAKCVGIEPCTIAMDLEGTDGRERGEDDTAFEKQSALFALAVSDIVLINMWCHDIGREQAANKPLLKTVFQVMMRLFSPRRTTLLFVIRDKTKTPLEILEPLLREDIQKIWDSVSKPPAHKNTPLSEFFNVEVTALASYEEKEEQFKEQVAQLRQRFFHSISPGGLAGDRRGVIPASGFSFSAQQIWKVIRENRPLKRFCRDMTRSNKGKTTEIPSSQTSEEVLADIHQTVKSMSAKMEQQATVMQQLSAKMEQQATVMQQLSAKMEQQAAPAACPETEEDRMAHTLTALKMVSSIFKGGYDSEAENWLEEVKKTLDMMGVTESRMVSLASYMLRGEANIWWETVKSTQDVMQMTWKQFEKIFLQKYIRSGTRIQKREEFRQLTQGNLSVTEYDAKFRELSRYEKDYMLDESSKIYKFQEGVRPSICRYLYEYSTYEELVKAALRLENMMEENKHRRSSQDGNKSQMFEQEIEENQNMQNQFGRRDDRRCINCGEVGHIKMNCPQNQQYQFYSSESNESFYY